MWVSDQVFEENKLVRPNQDHIPLPRLFTCIIIFNWALLMSDPARFASASIRSQPIILRLPEPGPGSEQDVKSVHIRDMDIF
jgi:hypothetical protein